MSKDGKFTCERGDDFTFDCNDEEKFCIHKQYKCNGVIECPNGSDESDCKSSANSNKLSGGTIAAIGIAALTVGTFAFIRA